MEAVQADRDVLGHIDTTRAELVEELEVAAYESPADTPPEAKGKERPEICACGVRPLMVQGDLERDDDPG